MEGEGQLTFYILSNIYLQGWKISHSNPVFVPEELQIDLLTNKKIHPTALVAQLSCKDVREQREQ